MDLTDIRNYVDRDWGASGGAPDSEATAANPADALARIDAARHFLRALCPGWPGETARADDLAHHVRLSALLRRVER